MRRWAAVALAGLAGGCQTFAPEPIPIARPADVAWAKHPPVPAAWTNAPAARPATVVAAKAETPAGAPPAEETIDLGVALRLAGVGNPTIALARERVREAAAAELGARSLLLPSVNVGGNYRVHRGAFQSGQGFIRNTDLQSLYLGAGAVGSGTVTIPGVRLFAHLGDAVFEPLAARQQTAVRRADAAATDNAVLLDVATRYLELVGAEARLDVLRRGEADVNEVVRITGVFAAKGQGRVADADRAEANADLLRRQLGAAEEDVAVASARLAGLLNLSPADRLRTPGGPVEPLRLLPEDSALEPLVEAAVRSRPEVAARAAAVGEAETRRRQERVRPWLPTVSAGFSAGTFGAGAEQTNTSLGSFAGRTDFDVLAVWNVQNLGLGNRARVRRTDALVGVAVAEYDAAVNGVRREVAEALAAAQAAARQIGQARAAVAIAEEGFQLEVQRTRQGLGRPIEVLDSFNQLLDARQELVRAVVAFDLAQFRLFVAVGNNPAAGECGTTATPQTATPGGH